MDAIYQGAAEPFSACCN